MLLVFGGISVALSVICLWLGSVISVNTFALLALASCFTGVMHIEGGKKYSILTFLSVAILSFILPVNKLYFLYYLCFFGYYPILKSYIEKINKLSFELIVKTVFFILISVIGIYVVSTVFKITISEILPWQIVAVIMAVVLHIYDYALSIFFNFYIRRIRNKIRR